MGLNPTPSPKSKESGVGCVAFSQTPQETEGVGGGGNKLSSNNTVESDRLLRDKLQSSCMRHPPKVVKFTSHSPSRGKICGTI